MKKSIGLSILCIFSFFLLNSFFREANKPTLFIIGDSTVKNGQGNGSNGQWGWGSFLGEYFNSKKINVKNYALGGTSSRSYYNNPKLWQKVLDSIQTGDFVLIQFGHNDSSPVVDTLRARGTLKGNGNDYEVVYNPLLKQNEVVYSYGAYIRRFIKNVQDKGAVAIVCSPIPRNAWETEKVRKSNYADWAKEAAKMSRAFFIPLQDLIIETYEKEGQKVVNTKYFDAKDATHTLKAGAELNAKIIAQYLKDNPSIGLKKDMK